jgi:hypothetical protein
MVVGGGWEGGGVQGGGDGREAVGVVAEAALPGPVEAGLQVQVGPLHRPGRAGVGELGAEPVDLDPHKIDELVRIEAGEPLPIGERGIQRGQLCAAQDLASAAMAASWPLPSRPWW